MKHHRTEDEIAIKTNEKIARELDRLLDKDIFTITDNDRCMLDLDPSDKAVMSMR